MTEDNVTKKIYIYENNEYTYDLTKEKKWHDMYMYTIFKKRCIYITKYYFLGWFPAGALIFWSFFLSKRLKNIWMNVSIKKKNSNREKNPSL